MSDDTYVDNLEYCLGPEAWTKGSLYPFIEQCWSNSIAVVGNKNVIARKAASVTSIIYSSLLITM